MAKSNEAQSPRTTFFEAEVKALYYLQAQEICRNILLMKFLQNLCVCERATHFLGKCLLAREMFSLVDYMVASSHPAFTNLISNVPRTSGSQNGYPLFC